MMKSNSGWENLHKCGIAPIKKLVWFCVGQCEIWLKFKSTKSCNSPAPSVDKGSESESVDASRVLRAAIRKLSAVDIIGNIGNVEAKDEEPGDELEDRCCWSSNCVGIAGKPADWGKTARSCLASCSCRFSDNRLEVEVDSSEVWNKFVLEHEGKAVVVCSDAIRSAECFASNIWVCVANAEAVDEAFMQLSKCCKSQLTFINGFVGWSLLNVGHSSSLFVGGRKKCGGGILLGSELDESLWWNCRFRFRLLLGFAAFEGQSVFIRLKVSMLLESGLFKMRRNGKRGTLVTNNKNTKTVSKTAEIRSWTFGAGAQITKHYT